MLFKVDDGNVVFATHFLRCTINREDEQVHEALASFQVEADGIVCYSQQEADTAQAILNQLGISYIIEPQTVDQVVKEKAAKTKYNSRSEAIKHLVEGITPTTGR